MRCAGLNLPEGRNNRRFRMHLKMRVNEFADGGPNAVGEA
jgi:hypothetical protein